MLKSDSVALKPKLEQSILPTTTWKGSIPSALFTLTDLTTINLMNNQLTGITPAEIGLSAIDFSKISLVEIGMPHLMRSFEVQNNNLAGTVPSELSGLTEIELVRIDGNPGFFESMPGAMCETLGTTTVSFSDCGNEIFDSECECCTICCTGGLCECNVADAVTHARRAWFPIEFQNGDNDIS
ncbi:hypothetical protein IV203_003384 [Nitzschia inconspicua]|uniref:L domain-like protein n=1 Tax=Nitzschia inconspicua TaxID=303405 RepID=A0A9K3PNN3_9STRA|nr:hypothetical protein IV203_003384 [Nitzschia inconspicua]